MKKHKEYNAQERHLVVRNPFIRILNYTLLLLILVLIFVPIYIVISMSLKTKVEFMRNSTFGLPNNILNIQNYITVFEKANLLTGFKNVLKLCIVSVTGSVILGLMVSYVLSRFKFRFKTIVLPMFLVAAIIPSMTIQVALFEIIKSIHLFNTIFAGMILYLGTDIVQIYIFMQFMNKIPYELDESALIDGASYFRIFWSIIIPQMKPAIATVVILKVLGIYNDMYIPYLYMPKASLRTVTTCILGLSYDKNFDWTLMSAGIVAVMLPTIILYLFFQRYIISGVSDGAVKS
jgi:raffinose/stachyose/melibiose transport system permease protein